MLLILGILLMPVSGKIKGIKEAITGIVISGSRRIGGNWKMRSPQAFLLLTHRTRALGMCKANPKDEDNSSVPSNKCIKPLNGIILKALITFIFQVLPLPLVAR